MIAYKDDTLSEYLGKLSSREPVPGGGSAAAVSGAMGASLIAMSARYSLGKGKPADIEKRIERIVAEADAARLRFIDLAGADAQAYLDVVKARKAEKSIQDEAARQAARVPRDVVELCRACLALTPDLHRDGNRYLLSDVKAAEAFLKAGIESAQYMQEVNA